MRMTFSLQLRDCLLVVTGQLVVTQGQRARAARGRILLKSNGGVGGGWARAVLDEHASQLQPPEDQSHHGSASSTEQAKFYFDLI